MRGGRPYDVILLGAGLSGLLAAAVLARRGRRVLVLKEADGHEDASPHSSGRAGASDDGPVLLPGFEREGLYDRLFMELGLSLSSLKQEGKLIHRSEIPFQMILPRHRLNFYQNRAELLDELQREFPDSASGIRSLFQEADLADPLLRSWYLSEQKTATLLKDRILLLRDNLTLRMKVGALQKNRARHFLERFHLDPEFQRGLESLIILSTGIRMEEASEFDLLLVLGFLGRDMGGLPGGQAGMADLLIGVIQKFQGEVVPSLRIKELMFHQKTVRQIRTQMETLNVEGALILNLDASRFTSENGKRGIVRLRFEVPEKFIPRSMKDYLMVSRSENGLEMADHSLFLALGGTGRDGNRRILEAALYRENPSTLEQEQIDRLRDSVMDQLIELMPFSKDSIEFLGHRISPSESDGRLSSICGDLTLRGRRQGTLFPGYFTTPYKNLYFLPDGGIRPMVQIGEVRSASELANRILQEGLGR